MKKGFKYLNKADRHKCSELIATNGWTTDGLRKWLKESLARNQKKLVPPILTLNLHYDLCRCLRWTVDKYKTEEALASRWPSLRFVKKIFVLFLSVCLA